MRKLFILITAIVLLLSVAASAEIQGNNFNQSISKAKKILPDLKLRIVDRHRLMLR
jgi:hypothetical protein